MPPIAFEILGVPARSSHKRVGWMRTTDEWAQFNWRRRPQPMMRTLAHLMPFAALAGGILILLVPRLLNYIVAIYLFLVGAIGLNGIYHFIR
jgi:hypothetical protein